MGHKPYEASGTPDKHVHPRVPVRGYRVRLEAIILRDSMPDRIPPDQTSLLQMQAGATLGAFGIRQLLA
ncbi:hypothetical protein DPMN_094613 [Dreissena polymorpha]|uniref:Uncharacterized protein n=1 Tax=Dreissena polymorpha TaxID=45954 RepID=A0A9D4L7Z1_DREPO|nr:hypothetical protein DPMN_094613 [Dreissena polymorpha]